MSGPSRLVLGLLDAVLAVFVVPAALYLKVIRRVGVFRLPLSKKVLFAIGVFPIRDHYYEPQFDNRHPKPPFSDDRRLPGIDWNLPGQLALLDRFTYAGELTGIPSSKPAELGFHFNNRNFESGDAEFWYQLIRTVKPKRIFEIGSGSSTLMAIRATRENQRETGLTCRHVCVEPYEMPWLEQTGITIVRSKVEVLDPSFFSELADGDILFIDSSHMIRPQGDVLYEYLELLPTLSKGVIVHVHDIFSPKNYLQLWLDDQVRFWNEQYLLEAFLSHNHDWQIIGAVNQLKNAHYDRLKAVAPYLTPDRQPGSFYLQRVA